MLSHHNLATYECRTWSSSNSFCIHIISAVAFANALYSASMLERDTMGCFQALQEIRLDPRNMANPPVDCPSSWSPTQSASKNALTRREDDLQILSPISKVCLRYLNILFTAAQWIVVGACKNWQTLFRTKEISGWVKVNYCKPPTMLLYGTKRITFMSG